MATEKSLAIQMHRDLSKGYEENDFELSDWEIEFLDSIADILTGDELLSGGQYNKLEEIHKSKI